MKASSRLPKAFVLWRRIWNIRQKDRKSAKKAVKKENTDIATLNIITVWTPILGSLDSRYIEWIPGEEEKQLGRGLDNPPDMNRSMAQTGLSEVPISTVTKTQQRAGWPMLSRSVSRIWPRMNFQHFLDPYAIML